MGLVLVVLNAPLGDPGLDLLPDPLGWALVLLGLGRLPDALPHRGPLRGLAAVSLVVSTLLWVPATARLLLGLDTEVRWVLDLPASLVVLLLARTLAVASGEAGDTGARGWWALVAAGAFATALLPPVVYGAGVAGLAVVAVAVAVATLVTCLVLCFAYAARPWADPSAAGSD